MPSIMEATAVGLRADMTSKAPLLILTSSESRTHRAVVSWQPPVMAHTAPTASPLPTCIHELQLLRSSRADAQHTQATFKLSGLGAQQVSAACAMLAPRLSIKERSTLHTIKQLAGYQVMPGESYVSISLPLLRP